MLRLSTGITRKIGLPNYGSAGASCSLEIELDAGLFQDLGHLQQVVRRAYAACNHAVQHELARVAAGQHASGRPNVLNTSRGQAAVITAGEATADIRPATASQLRAIRAIAARQSVDLQGLLQDRFGIGAVAELSLPQASELIDDLTRDGGMARPCTTRGTVESSTGDDT